MMHDWFFSILFSDLVLLVERSGKVTAISTSKKLNHLQKLSLNRVPCEKTFTQDDRQKLLDVLRAVPTQGEKLVVALPSEIHFGPIQEEASKTISAADFLQTTDAIPGLKLLLASKDEQEVLNCKRAALFACHYLQEIVVNKWMDALDQELTISHFAIVSQLQELADKEDVMKELCTKVAVDSSVIEVTNHLLQSGRAIDLTFGALPSKGDLAMAGTFILGVVVKHREYHAALTRTYVVNPTELVKKDYIFVQEVLRIATAALTAGTLCKDVYKAAHDFLTSQRPDLAERFGEDIGFLTGLCLLEKTWTLSANCDEKVPENSVFVLTIRLKPHPDEASGQPVWLSNTVFVPATGKAQILTSQCGSAPTDCFWELGDEEEEPAPAPKAPAPSAPSATRAAPERQRSRSRERAKGPASKPATNGKLPVVEQVPKAKAKPKAKGSAKAATKPKETGQASMTAYARQAKPKEVVPEPPRKPVAARKPPPARKPSPPRQPPKSRTPAPARAPVSATGPTLGRTTRSTTQRAKEAFAEQEQLERKQMAMRSKKLEELKTRWQTHGTDGFGGHASSAKRSLADCQAYASPAAMPKTTGQPRLRIDMDAQALLVPYQGGFLAWHVKMIKNMTRNDHDGEHFFRVNFWHPGQGKSADDYPASTENTAYVKELLFKSRETEMFDACINDLREAQRKIKENGIKAAHRQEAQQQQAVPLRELKGCPCIRDVNIRPNISRGARGSLGNLEAHVNGLKFSVRGSIEKLEIPYSHIKTAIFQPAETGSLVVFLHIHLKQSMMVGRKETRHVQFYTEVANQVEDLGKRRTANAHDPDEVMEEQRQEELKQRLNQLFKDFAQKVERIQDFPLKFEVAEEGPFQFQGVPSKTNMRLFCCRQSIVGIEEWPPLVVDIRDVEIVCFERALGHTREFDLVLVMKNYNEPIIRITMIDGRHLPPIKAWLADLDMVWYTIGMNMNWTNVLKHITEDIEEFLENGGWQAWFTNPNEDSSDDAGKDDGDDDYEPQDDDDDFDADAGDIEEDSSAEDDVEEDEDEDDMDEDAGDEDEDYDGADDDEDSGLDWDELEKEALEEEQRAKKRSRAPAGRGAAKAPPRKTRR